MKKLLQNALRSFIWNLVLQYVGFIIVIVVISLSIIYIHDKNFIEGVTLFGIKLEPQIFPPENTTNFICVFKG